MTLLIAVLLVRGLDLPAWAIVGTVFLWSARQLWLVLLLRSFVDGAVNRTMREMTQKQIEYMGEMSELLSKSRRPDL